MPQLSNLSKKLIISNLQVILKKLSDGIFQLKSVEDLERHFSIPELHIYLIKNTYLANERCQYDRKQTNLLKVCFSLLPLSSDGRVGG